MLAFTPTPETQSTTRLASWPSSDSVGFREFSDPQTPQC